MASRSVSYQLDEYIYCPKIHLCPQVGAPSDLQQYIHRLGRTGRAGKDGEGLLILAPWESYFLKSFQKLPVTELLLPKLEPQTTDKVVIQQDPLITFLLLGKSTKISQTVLKFGVSSQMLSNYPYAVNTNQYYIQGYSCDFQKKLGNGFLFVLLNKVCSIICVLH